MPVQGWSHGYIFEHENHAWPPALAENNNMRQGNKAALVGCLEQLSAPTSERPQPRREDHRRRCVSAYVGSQIS